MIDVKLAEQFMRHELVTLNPDSDVLQGVSVLLKSNISGAPVVDAEGTYLGVFSEKCCMNALTTVVETAVDEEIYTPTVREFMKTSLIKLTADWNVFEAIDHILGKRISGAPVVDADGRFIGIFSEKTAMRVLMAAIHDSVPGTRIEAYMNLDRNRVIEKEQPLIDVAHKFQETPYRRLPVLNGDKLAGQVSRRDVLIAEHRVSQEVVDKANRNGASDRLRQAAKLEPVGSFMDQSALTIGPKTDLLTVAQLFLNSPYRRLPVVNGDKKLVGQVSRRDLLETAASLMKPAKESRGAETLYLSQVATDRPSSIG